ncbi:MAG: HAMP domain-containing histidine kinase [Clostridia bacterium]|nr:HAMP domain-containing histidine kinase [Clostridia bacterium]
MKKIIYSPILKFLAVILFCTSMVLGVLTATAGIEDFYKVTPNLYSFENDFSESWYMASLLQEPERIVCNAYHEFYSGVLDEQGNPLSSKLEDLDQYIHEAIKYSLESNKINYYIEWNRLGGYANGNSVSDIRKAEFYSYVVRSGRGNVERESSLPEGRIYSWGIEEIDRYDRTSTIKIAVSVKEEVVEECRAAWERQERIVMETVSKAAFFGGIALLLLLYLVAAAGKKADGSLQNMWLDRIFLELHLLVMGVGGIGTIWLCALIIDEYQSGFFPAKLLYPALGGITALGSLVVLTSLLSVIRNIKTHTLVETSLILRLIRGIWRLVRDFLRLMIGWISKKSGVLFLVLLFLYTAAIGLLGIGTVISPVFLIFGVLLFLVAAFVLACRGKDLEEIKTGAARVKSGDLTYKIPGMKCSDLKPLAENVNTIAGGLDQAVAAQVKAERMKSELITNVSHDLKTPITSIISYTKLLSDMADLPEEARDYVAVIGKKSDRLKKLTQDLFDISKAQSGNEEVALERLNLVLLLQQALGEHDSDLQSSGLTFCVNVPKEAYISADGRKISRVLDNLISNILKYSLKNTRVFLTVTEKEGQVELECKNISAYPLDFDVEEITQRFVRGDESRTTEGNGLGLAIAKSYTELCGGKFEIVIDGDMFKAILRFATQS